MAPASGMEAGSVDGRRSQAHAHLTAHPNAPPRVPYFAAART
jgi:predicted Zn-dependent protease